MNCKTLLFLLCLLLLPIYSMAIAAQDKSALASNNGKQTAPAEVPSETHSNSTAEKQPTGRELIEQSLERARLEAELDRKRKLYNSVPQRKYIAASTQDKQYTPYMAAFIKKIMDIANANYPEELKRKKIQGRTTVTVCIGRDGSIKDVFFHAPLDQKPAVSEALKAAALKIVTSATPYAALPETSENIDYLCITRTWEFGDGSN